ncbi:tyrosine-type recombinase/integrase [Rhizobium panacihumi]|uniref:tyrosine-type recombinase/integrase n=1 Tax=Rhizobium panacihumi TaxID=2008450 RepID=UPI003D7AA0A1
MSTGRKKTINRLSDREIQGLPLSKKIHDGGGLYVFVSNKGSKSFVVRYTFDGKPREDGIGAYREKVGGKFTLGITLASAREVATKYRVLVSEGKDPRVEMRGEKPPAPEAPVETTDDDRKTFGYAADEYIKSHESEWRNAKHRQQWENTLKTYCKPIWLKDVGQITLHDVKDILQPIWAGKNETAARVRGRMESVFGYAQTMGWRETANPATWKGNLANVLAKRQKLQRGRMKAMPYAEAPAFYQKLSDHDGNGARALQFAILNASRSGEVRLAEWDEIDTKKKLWTIPGERLKRPVIVEGKPQPHVVPLSRQALGILASQLEARKEDESLVFPGTKENKPLSDMTLSAILRRDELPFHVHGFRTSFRNWAGAETNAQFEVVEKCLAHAIGNEVTRAYFRDELLEKRRELIAAWADYLAVKSGTE